MLSARGGRATANLAAQNGYAQLKQAAVLGRFVRMRQASIRMLDRLEARWLRVYGVSLLDFLIARELSKRE